MVTPSNESATRVVRGGMAIAVVAAAVVASTANAQLLAAPIPATCGPTADAKVAVDPTLINGVVVRLGVGKSDRRADAFLAHAMSEAVASHLERHIALPVQFRPGGQQRGARNALAEGAAAVAEGRVLGVQWVVSGNVERSNDINTVTWRTYDARTGEEKSGGSFTAPVMALDSAAASIAARIAATIDAGASSDVGSARSMASRSTRAFELLLEGLFYSDGFDPESWKRAESALRQALAADSMLLPAWQALAALNVRYAMWGEGPNGTRRTSRIDAAVNTANHALSLDNRNVRSLLLVAHAHLLRNEPVPARQAIDGLRNLQSNNAALEWLEAESQLLEGRGQRMAALQNAVDYRVMNDPDQLFVHADWQRRNGQVEAACRSLNRVLAIDPRWAPAAAMRSVVRAQLGDRRGAWIDAEIASRLGRPGWGRAAGALADVAAGDSSRARDRMRGVTPPTRLSASYMQALLNSAALFAIRDTTRARAWIVAMECADPAARWLTSDPLVRKGVTAATAGACRRTPSLGGP